MKNSSPAWPFLSVLACLFVLCITTPRAWERIARTGSLSKRLAAIKRGPKTTQEAPAPAPDSPAPAQPPAVDIAHAPAHDVAPAAKPRELADLAPALASAANALDARRFVAGSGRIVLQAAPAFGRQVSDRLIEIASRPLPPALMPDPPLSAPAPTFTAALSRAAAEQQAIVPVSLFEQLHAFEWNPLAREWARAVQSDLRELSSAGDGAAIFGELESLIADGQRLAADAADPALQSALLRAGYAVERRMPVWRRVLETDSQGAESFAGSRGPSDADALVARSLAELETLGAVRSDGVSWRELLELDRLNRAARDPQTSDASRRRLARRVLDKLASASAKSVSRAAIEDARVATLAAGLEYWANGPAHPRGLLAEIETYERTGLASDARAVAASVQTLARSPREADQRLAAELTGHYSNANFRLAVSREFLNRLAPPLEMVQLPIVETLGGTPVRGQGAASTRLKVVLIPDAQRIRLGLEADGTVQSNTMSEVGPAKFRNASISTFHIQKLFVLGPRGLRVWPAVAEAHSSPASLVGLETSYDRIPVVSYLVRSVARSKHEETAQTVAPEADYKLANRVRAQFDAEVAGRVAGSQTEFKQRFGESLDRLHLAVTPVSLSTTEDRAVMRYRLAGPEQLGAHTPRPRAPSDSLLSVQLHQSAINNFLAGLDLDGQRFTLPELFAKVGEKLGRPDLKAPDDISEDITVTFAPQNAIRVELKDNRLDMRLAIAELIAGHNRWRDFTVRAKYALWEAGLEASLQRESGISLEGASMKGKPEIVLRGIFGRALSQRRHIPLSFEKIAHDPRFKDLTLSQLVIEDGWIGLAYGPRTAEREARRQKANAAKR